MWCIRNVGGFVWYLYSFFAGAVIHKQNGGERENILHRFVWINEEVEPAKKSPLLSIYHCGSYQIGKVVQNLFIYIHRHSHRHSHKQKRTPTFFFLVQVLSVHFNCSFLSWLLRKEANTKDKKIKKKNKKRKEEMKNKWPWTAKSTHCINLHHQGFLFSSIIFDRFT